MEQSTNTRPKRNERDLIAVTFYVVVALAAYGFTLPRYTFEPVGCSGTCDFAAMHRAMQPFLWFDLILLVVVVIAFVVMWTLRIRSLWLSLSALIVTAVYAVIANVAFSVAQTTGTG